MYHGPLPEIKEEMLMPTTTYGNNDRLTERINRCHDPRAALAVLCAVLAMAQGNATPEAIKAILEDQEKGDGVA